MRKSTLTETTLVPGVAALVALPLVIGVWLSAVSKNVGEPYLDEIFHVGQAQMYCAGRLREWDPKITTPPGLYIISYLVYQVSGFCGTSALRVLNAVLLSCIFLVVLYMSSPSRSREATSTRSTRGSSFLAHVDPQQIHTAFNICLFPPLFFFCSLYYTDVGSTLFVLLFLKHFYDSHSQGAPTIFQSLVSVLLGLIALTFRQTNIFWVGVFPIGFLVIGGVAEKRIASRNGIDRNYTLSIQLQALVEKSWRNGLLYDPSIQGAWLEDYFLNIVFIVMLVLRTITMPQRLLRLVRLVLPYVTLLALFGGFVIWNGGVVLGDKSNHVATLHLPQMLYIWPYITFFSFPLTYPFILQGALSLLAIIPVVSLFEPLLVFGRRKILPRPIVVLPCVGLAMLIVRYNTIVHPFTLADNRHYTFYVFRILMRHPIFKYLAVPVYLVCAWSAIQTLGASANLFVADEDMAKDVDDPGCSSKAAATLASIQVILFNDASLGEGSTVSFVVVWLITSALALVTAPLVEPRYFIIPWVMWRLRTPQAHPGAPKSKGTTLTANSVANALARVLWLEHDHRLWLETAWFLGVNAVTCWVFLNKGFTWLQEPQNVQRFMW
ncbi:alpha-2-glucosyltransferase Alg10 [Delphinella strobiligena]|nr:alpha-2-glucosyltransferase Alg10 [Delphinella strobiligena]